MKARVELLEILVEAEKDVRNGRIAPVSNHGREGIGACV